MSAAALLSPHTDVHRYAKETLCGATWNDITRLNGIAWRPDQRHLLFVTRNVTRAEDGTVVWKLSTAGGAPDRTGITSKDVIRALTLSTDGEQLAMAISTARPRAIWALEHFLSLQTERW